MGLTLNLYILSIAGDYPSCGRATYNQLKALRGQDWWSGDVLMHCVFQCRFLYPEMPLQSGLWFYDYYEASSDSLFCKTLSSITFLLVKIKGWTAWSWAGEKKVGLPGPERDRSHPHLPSARITSRHHTIHRFFFTFLDGSLMLILVNCNYDFLL